MTGLVPRHRQISWRQNILLSWLILYTPTIQFSVTYRERERESSVLSTTTLSSSIMVRQTRSSKWSAQICRKKIMRVIGRYTCKEQAIKAEEIAKKHYAEQIAKLNHPYIISEVKMILKGARDAAIAGTTNRSIIS